MRGNLDKMDLDPEVYAMQRTALEEQADAIRKQLLLTVLQ
jgi:hypothetical protein